MKTPSFTLRRRRPGWRLSLLVCLLILLGTGACTPPAASEPRADVTAAVPRGLLSQALQSAAEAYRQSTGRRVEVIALSANAYAVDVEAALLAGLDRYDLVLLPGDSLARWAGYHVILPLETPADAAGLAPWLAALEVDGQLYGLPTQPEVEVLWYRGDLLAEAGLAVPGTWAGIEQAARALNAPPQRYGAVIAGGPLDAGSEFAAVLAGFGGAVVGPDGQVQVGAPAAVEALAWYAGLHSPGGVVPPAADRFTRADALRLLRDGRAGLGIAPLSAAAVLQDCSASPDACAAGRPLLEWTWLPGPGGAIAPGSLSAWAVPLRAANPEMGADFAAWLCGEAGGRAWAAGGGVPAHRAALAGLDRVENALSQVEVFQPAFPPIATASQVWQAIHAAAHAAVAGEQMPAEALREAQLQVEKAVRRVEQ